VFTGTDFGSNEGLYGVDKPMMEMKLCVYKKAYEIVTVYRSRVLCSQTFVECGRYRKDQA
jgi:hypothetical protein